MSKKTTIVAGLMALSVLSPSALVLANQSDYKTGELTNIEATSEKLKDVPIAANREYIQRIIEVVNQGKKAKEQNESHNVSEGESEDDSVTTLGAERNASVGANNYNAVNYNGKLYNREGEIIAEGNADYDMVCDVKAMNEGRDYMVYLPTQKNLDKFIEEGTCPTDTKNSFEGIMNCFRLKEKVLADAVLYDQSHEHAQKLMQDYPWLQNYLSPEEAAEIEARTDRNIKLQQGVKELFAMRSFQEGLDSRNMVLTRDTMGRPDFIEGEMPESTKAKFKEIFNGVSYKDREKTLFYMVAEIEGRTGTTNYMKLKRLSDDMRIEEAQELMKTNPEQGQKDLQEAKMSKGMRDLAFVTGGFGLLAMASRWKGKEKD